MIWNKYKSSVSIILNCETHPISINKIYYLIYFVNDYNNLIHLIWTINQNNRACNIKLIQKLFCITCNNIFQIWILAFE